MKRTGIPGTFHQSCEKLAAERYVHCWNSFYNRTTFSLKDVPFPAHIRRMLFLSKVIELVHFIDLILSSTGLITILLSLGPRFLFRMYRRLASSPSSSSFLEGRVYTPPTGGIFVAPLLFIRRNSMKRIFSTEKSSPKISQLLRIKLLIMGAQKSY